MLVSKLQKMPDLLQVYSLFRSRNSEDDDAEDVHYLPHHLMKKESVTTPIRIVYDCSCQGGGNSASLNDCLMVGLPFQMIILCAILLCFHMMLKPLCNFQWY